MEDSVKMCFALFILSLSAWRKLGTVFASHQIYVDSVKEMWRRWLLFLLHLWELFLNLSALRWHCCCCSICKHSEKYWNANRECAVPMLTVTSREMDCVLDLYSSSVSKRQVALTLRPGSVAWWRKAFNSLLLEQHATCLCPRKPVGRKEVWFSGTSVIYSHSYFLFLYTNPCEVFYKKHSESQFLWIVFGTGLYVGRSCSSICQSLLGCYEWPVISI